MTILFGSEISIYLNVTIFMTNFNVRLFDLLMPLATQYFVLCSFFQNSRPPFLIDSEFSMLTDRSFLHFLNRFDLVSLRDWRRTMLSI